MYEVVVTPHAERDVKRLDRQIKNQILSALVQLADNPRPTGCLKVKNRDSYGVFVLPTGASGTIGHRRDFYE